jgi:hypothetical protein
VRIFVPSHQRCTICARELFNHCAQSHAKVRRTLFDVPVLCFAKQRTRALVGLRELVVSAYELRDEPDALAVALQPSLEIRAVICKRLREQQRECSSGPGVPSASWCDRCKGRDARNRGISIRTELREAFARTPFQNRRKHGLECRHECLVAYDHFQFQLPTPVPPDGRGTCTVMNHRVFEQLAAQRRESAIHIAFARIVAEKSRHRCE